MAVKEKKDYPMISTPVGSREEIEVLDPKLLRTVATCSEHTADNMGCLSWEECELAWKGTRPRNVSYRTWKQNGKIREAAGHCARVLHAQIQVEANKGLIEIMGDEGSAYAISGTRRIHEQRDVTCNACMAGQCGHRPLNAEEKLQIVPALPPAKEHRDLVDFENARIIRERRSAQHKERVTGNYLNDPGKGKHEPQPAGSDAGSHKNRPDRAAQASASGGLSMD